MSKFCKVCFQAGKDESVYKSHFVRASAAMNALVVCPTLLSTECKYCHKAGHTVKYCAVLKNNEKMRRRAHYPEKKETTTTEVKRRESMFEALLDSDDEEEEEEEEEEERPLQGWAAIVAKKPVMVEKEKKASPLPQMMCETLELGFGKSRSWIDMMNDSDSDDDE